MEKNHTIKESKVNETEPGLFDTLGDELKRARIRKKLTIDVVADTLKIRAIYIKALEENQYTVFPAIVYGVAFLRTYADYLGLDTADLVSRFKEETNHLITPPTELPIRSKNSIMPSKFVLFCMVVALIGIWIAWSSVPYVSQLHFSFEKLPVVQTMTAEQSEMPKSDIQSMETILALPETQIETGVNLSDVQDINKVSDASDELSKSKITEDIVLSTDVSDKVDEVSNENLSEKIVSDAFLSKITGQKYGDEAQTELVIVAKSRVWIDVKENKKVIFNQILSAGDAYFVPQSENDLIMRTGNASGLEVYINGVSKGLLSERETVKNNIILKPSSFER